MGADRAARVLGALGVLGLLGCPGGGPAVVPPGPTPSEPGPPATARALHATIFFTSDEHGGLLPNERDGRRFGGVGPLLAHLRGDGRCGEGERAVAFVPGTWAPPLAPDAGLTIAAAEPEPPGPTGTACETRADATFLLSGGDNYTGPPVSGLYRGETTAAALARLGYDASALGNHDFDFGREQFLRNRAVSGVRYLAANLHATDDASGTGSTPFAEPYAVLERGGVRLGVVGLATKETPKVGAAKLFVGLGFEDEEQALVRTVPEVWRQGVDAVVVVAHVCHDEMEPIVARHPEWHLAFVGTGHCHETHLGVQAGAPVVAPDWRFEHYARVTLDIDRSRPAPAERARPTSHELVAVGSSLAQPQPSRAASLDATLAGWQAEVDAKLGEVVGHARAGYPRRSATLGRWMTRAWRETYGADVAVTTLGAIRDDLPAGAIRVATVYAIMPFDNDLVVCTVPGDALAAMLREPKAVVSGLVCQDGRCTHEDGSPLDRARRYRVVVTDFLFHGGDGFRFHEVDPSPTFTGVNWREPVLAWTRAHAPDEAHPLEAALAPGPAPGRR
ncbi:MAG: bifunctional metallophosphatase/5'-nucleotidase [Myxococcales bacterium]|nr:bifunctional metallophosphatase/5'-nucleotidase [Myxococcales bacterium]